ncbi:hypothetical protein BC567DRAFT_248578 [Phyllosticta citribraziliensis]
MALSTPELNIFARLRDVAVARLGEISHVDQAGRTTIRKARSSQRVPRTGKNARLLSPRARSLPYTSVCSSLNRHSENSARTTALARGILPLETRTAIVPSTSPSSSGHATGHTDYLGSGAGDGCSRFEVKVHGPTFVKKICFGKPGGCPTRL